MNKLKITKKYLEKIILEETEKALEAAGQKSADAAEEKAPISSMRKPQNAAEAAIMALQAYILVHMDEKDFKTMGFSITRDQMYKTGAPVQGSGKYKTESFIDGRFGPLTRKGLSLIQDVPPDIDQQIKFADGKIVVTGMSTQDDTNQQGYEDTIPVNMEGGDLSVTNVPNFAEEEVVDDTDVAQAEEAEITADAENNAQQQQQQQQQQQPEQQQQQPQEQTFAFNGTLSLTDKPVDNISILINGAVWGLRAAPGSGRFFLMDGKSEIRKFASKVISSPDDKYNGNRLKARGYSTKGLHMYHVGEDGGEVDIIYPVKPNQILAMVRDLYRLEKGEKIPYDASSADIGKYKFEIKRQR